MLSQHLPKASLPLIFLLTTQHLQAIHDTNQNGVSDLWEKKYNSGNLYSNFNPTADPDGDGWTNAQEAAAGTDPNTGAGLTGLVRPNITHTPALYLSPEEEGGQPALVPPEVMTITWPTVAGKKYTLLFSTDLTAGNWTAIGSPRIGEGTEIGTSIPLTQPDGSTPARLFWRVTISDVDTDSDTLTNAEEAELGSSPYSSDGDNDSLSDLAELFTYHTNPISRDSDGDGVSDPDEILLNFTNPLTATDADGDGIPDDLEKDLAKQFLSFQPNTAPWGMYYAGLAAGNLDSNHDYTGDGVSVGNIASVLTGDSYTNQTSNSAPYLLETQKRMSYFGGSYRPASQGQPAFIQGGISLWLTRDTTTVIKTNRLEDFSYAFLNQNFESAFWFPLYRALPLNSPDSIWANTGGANWSCANFQDYPTTDGSRGRPYGTFIQTRFRVFSKKISHADYERPLLKVTSRYPALVDGTLLNTTFSAKLMPFSLKNGRFYSNWAETQTTMTDSQSAYALLYHVDLITDLDNDGGITSADNSLRDAAMVSGATDEIQDKGTEFIFQNDNLSNGIWDSEDTDPARPIAAKDDDDAEPINLQCGIYNGEVWLDHPAIAGISFYKTRECRPEDKVNISPSNKFSVSSSNPCPSGLFMRVDGNLTYPDANPQIEGDLVLKIKVDASSPELEIARMKLTVVKDFGAKKYFHAVRDYIFENNTKTFTQEKAYGNSKYRIVGMREESTVMSGLDTYDHARDEPRLRGIDEVKANYGSDVIINGNQCFFHDGRSVILAALRGQMTTRCDGRLCVAKNILRPPSDDIHNPNLGGGTARYVGYTGGEPLITNGQISVPSEFNFATGQIPEANPATPDHGIGGLAALYSRPELQNSENQAIGRGPVIEVGKGIIFTATTYVGNLGKAELFAADARKSGVKPLSGGDGSQWELLFLDGSSSVGLVLTNPLGVQKTLIKGGKHTGSPYYYINTYLLFNCQKPRN